MDLFSPLLYNGRKGTYFILLACNHNAVKRETGCYSIFTLKIMVIVYCSNITAIKEALIPATH